MNDDGTMARMDDLQKIAKEHDLKIGTIADLIAYRRKHEKLVEKILEQKISTVHGGEFDMKIYTNKIEYAEHIVLVKPSTDLSKPTLVRMHAVDVMNDVLQMDQTSSLQKIMSIMQEENSGVLVLIREPRKTALSDKVREQMGETYSGFSNLRDYGIGAQILIDLGVKDMILLSNAQRQVVGLDGYGLNIKEYRSF